MPGEIRLYLNPEVTDSSSLRLCDIAKIEYDEQGDIASMVIPESFCQDGYIEASEVRALLGETQKDVSIKIFGSAVRIRSAAMKNDDTDAISTGEIAIQNGDRVDVILRHKGIVVRTFGTALTDGKKGDRVFVKTAQAKRLAGKIAGRGTVEVLP